MIMLPMARSIDILYKIVAEVDAVASHSPSADQARPFPAEGAVPEIVTLRESKSCVDGLNL